jgi:hypothetical protein
MAGFHCQRCGKYHEELPLHFVIVAPEDYLRLDEDDRRRRCELSSDQCLIDGRHCYLLGNLELPITDQPQTFSWDIWVALRLDQFKRASDLWNTEGRESEPPYPVTLASRIRLYPDTLGLKATLHTRKVGIRPRIELEPCDHPLFAEQQDGISLARVQTIAEELLHP